MTAWATKHVNALQWELSQKCWFCLQRSPQHPFNICYPWGLGRGHISYVVIHTQSTPSQVEANTPPLPRYVIGHANESVRNTITRSSPLSTKGKKLLQVVHRMYLDAQAVVSLESTICRSWTTPCYKALSELTNTVASCTSTWTSVCLHHQLWCN